MVGIEQGTLDFIRRSRIDRINVVDTSAIVAIKRNKYEFLEVPIMGLEKLIKIIGKNNRRIIGDGFIF